jgi:hypothetical protein
MIIFFAETDQVFRIPGIADRDGTPQPDALVEVTLTDTSGVPIAGVWPQVAEYVDTTDGANFELFIGDALELLPNAEEATYRAVTRIVLSSGAKTTIVDRIQVMVRT